MAEVLGLLWVIRHVTTVKVENNVAILNVFILFQMNAKMKFSTQTNDFDRSSTIS